MSKFSIVIAVFNKAEFIKNTIQSVLNQTIQEFELVIVNDGSTDGSESAILAFKDDRIHYVSQSNKGASAARNVGIQQASNPYIAFLDADDKWLPDHLETIQKLMNEVPGEKVFATNSLILRNNKQFGKSYSVSFSRGSNVVNYFQASLLDSILHSSTLVAHADVFKQVGMYDHELESGEDTDLYVRIGVAYQVVFNPKVCVHIQQTQNSLMLATQTIAQKPDFKKYEALEASNIHLKKYLDQNRYSLCILAKRTGDHKAYNENLKKIDFDNLNKKQQQLLKLPGSLIRTLLKFKKLAERFGIRPVIRK